MLVRHWFALIVFFGIWGLGGADLGSAIAGAFCGLIAYGIGAVFGKIGHAWRDPPPGEKWKF
jgi:uncharacterized membrane protein